MKMKIIVYSLFCCCLFVLGNLSAQIPAGYYYLANGKQKATLKSALSQIASQARFLAYGSGEGATWAGFYQVDRGLNNLVIDMYSSENRYFSGYASVDGMHIEHAFPKSWWGSYQNNAYKDLYHLYPADAVTNSAKSNLPLGIVGVATFDNGMSRIGTNVFGSYVGNSFEPDDSYKGDFARSYFYIATVYENYAAFWDSPMLENNTYPTFQPWAIDLLLAWHRQDPVSQKEIDRLEAIYAIQGNRNPFIDYPNLVEYIWGTDTSQTYYFPVETRPFLVVPNQWNTIDFGVVLANDTPAIILPILGKNLTQNIQVDFKHNTSNSLLLSTGMVSATDAMQGYDVTVTCIPSGHGVITDTLIIFSGDLADTLQIPIRIVASRDFMALPPQEITATSATLQWMRHPDASSYQIDIYTETAYAGDLFIAAYLEGSSWNKALTIYNGTGKTVDLSKYSISKQNNGLGAFIERYQLSGLLPHGATYVLVHPSADAALLALSNHLPVGADAQNNIMSFNGNDCIALLHEDVIIDLAGELDNPTDWGKDITLKRQPTSTQPTTQFSWNEWQILPINTNSALSPHTLITTSDTLLKRVNSTAADYTLTDLMPEQSYIYQVIAMNAGLLDSSVNRIRFNTIALESPEILEATSVHQTGFTVNWEEVFEATSYELDLFIQPEITAVVETFDNVGSNGIPLPAGWSGTATGNYTSAQSSGAAPPAMALKNSGEWLKVEYPFPITDFSFMYRYPSSGAGSYMTVEASDGTIWQVVDSIHNTGTVKQTKSYNFNSQQQITQMRLTYALKVSGNLAIDDVAATYAASDTLFILQQMAVVGNSYPVVGLVLDSTYSYRMRSVYKTVFSPWSNVMSATTHLPGVVSTPLVQSTPNNINVFGDDTGIYIKNAEIGAMLYLYSSTGVCLHAKKVATKDLYIPMKQRGLFIINMVTKQHNYSVKLVK